MANLEISDILRDEELDVAAAHELRGGMNYGFLSGLFAGRDSMMARPSIVQNFMYQYNVDYDHTVIELAPIHYNNVASNGSIANSTGNSFTTVIGQAEVNALSGLLSQG